jgi:hypothetical protein
MNRITYLDFCSIAGVDGYFDPATFFFHVVRPEGVFLRDYNGREPTESDMELLRLHPTGNLMEPVFTFPCSVDQMRELFYQYGAYDQLSGVITLNRQRRYLAKEVLGLMISASKAEEDILPMESVEVDGESTNWRAFLKARQSAETYYRNEMLASLRRLGMMPTSCSTLSPAAEVDLLNQAIPDNDTLANWLVENRFAVSFETTTTASKVVAIRADPVREIIIDILRQRPTLTKTEMWSALVEMAQNRTPPFLGENDKGELRYIAGGKADAQQKTLSQLQFSRRFVNLRRELVD